MCLRQMVEYAFEITIPGRYTTANCTSVLFVEDPQIRVRVLQCACELCWRGSRQMEELEFSKRHKPSPEMVAYKNLGLRSWHCQGINFLTVFRSCLSVKETLKATLIHIYRIYTEASSLITLPHSIFVCLFTRSRKRCESCSIFQKCEGKVPRNVNLEVRTRV